MNIVEINSVNKHSTGSIVRSISEFARKRGHVVLECFPLSRSNKESSHPNDYFIGNRVFRNIGLFLTRHFRFFYFVNILTTYRFIKKLKLFKPDVIHIHNIHPIYMNVPMLVNYINKNNIKTVITLHDCWLYTGHCAYYTYIGCEKWKTKCSDCKLFREYPSSCWDDSSYMFEIKKRLITSLKYLSIVPVSKWLGKDAGDSFILKDKSISVISNGVDLTVFKPYINEQFDNKYNFENKFVIMGCATGWGERKGLNDYIKLSEILNDDEIIILVGFDTKMLPNKPDNVIVINRTENRKELAWLYTRANVVLSLSKGETFGLTIIEAMACGTPAIVYNNTAQPELINGKNGCVAVNGDVLSVRSKIDELKTWDKEKTSEDCIEFAKKYSNEIVYNQYVDLFETLKNN